MIALAPPAPGRLVLCTDGLWNYVPAAADLAQLTESLDPHAAPASVAHHLADVAIARGTRDNVTVAVIDVTSPGGPAAMSRFTADVYQNEFLAVGDDRGRRDRHRLGDRRRALAQDRRVPRRPSS